MTLATSYVILVTSKPQEVIAMAKRATRNYVNNRDLLEALVAYKALCREAEDAGEGRPRVPDYIGECIFQIATRLATKPNFSGYSYKEDMISDGIENCLQYCGNFNPEKSKNPFAYFTQIIYYAFIRRIQKEKKQQHIRHKVIENMSVDVLAVGEDMEQAQFVEYLQKNFLPSEDVYKPKKKKKTEPRGLEKFYDDEGENINENSADN